MAGTGAMLGRLPLAAMTSLVLPPEGEPKSSMGTSRWPNTRPVVTFFTFEANSVTARFSRVGEESRRGLPSESTERKSAVKKEEDLRRRVEKKLLPPEEVSGARRTRIEHDGPSTSHVSLNANQRDAKLAMGMKGSIGEAFALVLAKEPRVAQSNVTTCSAKATPGQVGVLEGAALDVDDPLRPARHLADALHVGVQFEGREEDDVEVGEERVCVELAEEVDGRVGGECGAADDDVPLRVGSVRRVRPAQLLALQPGRRQLLELRRQDDQRHCDHDDHEELRHPPVRLHVAVAHRRERHHHKVQRLEQVHLTPARPLTIL
ncbi:hypothetical protein TYRP_001148 [Tyrophagus putrescentiae]|nr:hypothetical protein TYRP_001148 [Tyrophagus putrescentiae]